MKKHEQGHHHFKGEILEKKENIALQTVALSREIKLIHLTSEMNKHDIGCLSLNETV